MSDKHQPTVVLPADSAGLARASVQLRQGGLVAVPTETVYGLAARADQAEAVAAIYRAKGRPDFNPLIVHVASLAAAQEIALFDPLAVRLASTFWPGALTLVLPLKDRAAITSAVTAGLPTIALRCPAHPVMQALLDACGLPLAAPSANRSGAVSPVTAAHVAASLGGKVPLILDGGASGTGLESTIVALRPDGAWQILRPGPVVASDLEAVLGSRPVASQSGAIEAPGQLVSHYAPGKPVRLDAVSAQPDEFLIGFAGIPGDYSLSVEGDLAVAAARLYHALHFAAASPHHRIAVAKIPDRGMGVAINDRLRRAAA